MSIMCAQIGRKVLSPLSREENNFFFTDTSVIAAALVPIELVQYEDYR